MTRSDGVIAGKRTGATPDGRLAGTPLASSVAASVGCEKNGPTAVLNSIIKLDALKNWKEGYNANIRFGSAVFKTESDRAKLRMMLNAFFLNDGQELQINTVDPEVLIDAQKHPERYQDLVVRIAGFSEFFVRLCPEHQADIIARETHSL